MSNRNIRVSELLKREVSDILHTRYQRETVTVTVTGVDVSPDHSNAIVFYTLSAGEEERWKIQKFLDRIGGRVRFELGKRIVLKRLPALNFKYDESIAKGNRIIELIDGFDESINKSVD